MTVYLGKEFAVKNKGKNNTVEGIRNYIFCIFEKSHLLCRANSNLAGTFQKTYQRERNINNTVAGLLMKAACKLYDLLVDSKLIDQNVLILIFRLHKQLVPFLCGKKQGGITDYFRALPGKILYNISTVILTDKNLIEIRKKSLILWQEEEKVGAILLPASVMH